MATGFDLVPKRKKRRRRKPNFDPRQDFIAGFCGPDVEIVRLPCGRGHFRLPSLRPGITGALLELDVRAKYRSGYVEPALEFAADSFSDVQFIDPGAAGKRYFNVTRLLAACPPDSLIKLRGRWLDWNGDNARLYLCRERLSSEERLLLVSPHPDDAELASFGLYASMKSTVVTVTAGDSSKRFEDAGMFPTLGRALRAKLRVWDSITIPGLGGVGSENAVNLCYPDRRLSEMQKEPGRDFRNDGQEPLDFEGLRRLNGSGLISAAAGCSWNSLVQDFEHILTRVRPTIIVTPHPALDPHPDHVSATAAVTEAVEKLGLREGRFFYACIHNRYSELWPYGPLGTGVAHLPVLTALGGTSKRFYSHALSPQLQLQKFLAIEAMHDVRNIAWPGGHTCRKAIKRLGQELRSLWSGPQPLNYIRRSIRPDEPFFVSDFDSPVAPPRDGAAAELLPSA